MARRYDTIIVGGSCAGLRTAELLAAAGQRVLVLERRRHLDQLARTWIVTEHLEPVLGFTPHQAIVHRTGVMRMHAGRAVRDVQLANPDLIVERARILPMLAERAIAAGAEIRCGFSAVNIEARERGLGISAAARGPGSTVSEQTDTLIGADGVHSTVARHFRARAQNTVPIVQAKIELPSGYDADFTEIWFQPQTTRFFFWLIPESTRTGALGVIAEKSCNARVLLDRFLQERGIKALEYQGAMIPLHQPFRRIDWRLPGGGRVLLVGDAAAHVKVTTVGGLVSGLWGAKAAADSLIKGTSYRRELRSLHAELHVHDMMRWVLDRFTTRDYEQMLGLLGHGLQAVLGRHNRDSVARAKWSLLAAQPRIVTLAAKAVLFP
ncbi:MAG TPA: NAD(P)/FAD-dependent oxidoreductase [Longimicrobiales bacterium]|nr:NAD(P)/FAD-dependent oxidoreductase [Longimicrobiales bacterium]